jgi:hypothetical protein
MVTRKKKIGADHPDTLISIANLALATLVEQEKSKWTARQASPVRTDDKENAQPHLTPEGSGEYAEGRHCLETI